MRPEKQLIVEDLSKQVKSSPFVLMTDYAKLTVENFTDLRKRLAGANAECHVVKNTTLTRALDAAGLPRGQAIFSGMTAIVVGGDKSEVSAVAKILKQFHKDTQKSQVKLGFMGQQTLTADDVLVLAELPSLDALRANLIGLLQTPATRIAVVLGAPASQIARVIKAHADKAGDVVAA